MWMNILDADKTHKNIIQRRKYALWIQDNQGKNADTRPKYLLYFHGGNNYANASRRFLYVHWFPCSIYRHYELL